MTEIEGSSNLIQTKGSSDVLYNNDFPTEQELITDTIKSNVDGLVKGDLIEGSNSIEGRKLQDTIKTLKLKVLKLEGMKKQLELEGYELELRELDTILFDLNKTITLLLDIFSENLTDISNIDYNIGIEDLGFPVRVINRLESGKIHTLGKLLSCSESDLFKIPNLGIGTLFEIKKILGKKKLILGMPEEILISYGYNPEK